MALLISMPSCQRSELWYQVTHISEEMDVFVFVVNVGTKHCTLPCSLCCVLVYLFMAVVIILVGGMFSIPWHMLSFEGVACIKAGPDILLLSQGKFPC